jgi:hypothetical protein
MSEPNKFDPTPELPDDTLISDVELTPKRPMDPKQLAKSIIDIATWAKPDPSLQDG